MTNESQTKLSKMLTPPSPVAGSFADPALIRWQDRWWLFPTTDGFRNWESASFRALSSVDLLTWEDHGEILRLGQEVEWASERAWAPAMFERDGYFYFYFTANFNIGVAVGTSPTGPFKDIGRPLISQGEFEGVMIDPSIFEDADGSVYLYWGNGVAHGVKLNPDLVSFDRSEVVSWDLKGFREAAWVHSRDGAYYMSWSENDTRSEDYRVRYATGPSPVGPWEHQGLILEKDSSLGILSTGHHCIIQAPGEDSWVIAAHRFGIPEGNGYNREIFFAPLRHDSKGLMETVKFPSSPFTISLVDHSRP